MSEERYHETLGLRPGATRDELKTAYRDMAKVWHPDRFAHDPRLQSMAQEKLKEINEAYKQLTSPRPARARQTRRDTYAAHADATRHARTRHYAPPPVIVVRETRAQHSSLPFVAAVVVIAAVTFFAATRVFTNRPGATADAAAAQLSTVAPAASDSAELSSDDAQTAAGASTPSESKEKSRLKSVVGTLASPGKWFKKKKEKTQQQ